ncbi:hypothetical protein FDUTEX481_00827 [Tolypothrix sp. PCC 7601]|nr:hypothetical protein FDUTEX481_00827 [Tolypothrix sp. PCC 7601]
MEIGIRTIIDNYLLQNLNFENTRLQLSVSFQFLRNLEICF